jgi:hypothetical protein
MPFIAIGFLLFFLLKPSKSGDTQDMGVAKNFTIADAQSAIIQLANDTDVDKARLVEQMLRLETAHMTSKEYKQTGSAGMEDGQWANLPAHDTLPFVDNQDGHTGHFIVWDSVYDFCKYLSDYIDRYDGNYARWNTTDINGQLAYEARVQSVKARFV